MAKAYFFSDVHLGLGSREQDKQKEARLLSFLDLVMKDADHLFILGDLFDAWIEYRTVIPKGFHRTLTKLEDLTRRSISVHYLAGNHDYWLADFFPNELGIEVYLDPFEFTLDDKRIYLHHGDGLALYDGGYRMLKRILRSPLNIMLYKWLHPDIGLALAQTSSKKSRQYTSSKNYGKEDGMSAFAGKMIASGYDAVIMGHRHRPLYEVIGSGVYINLGDWINHNTYATLENGKFELLHWEA